jgi:hypothetical protein
VGDFNADGYQDLCVSAYGTGVRGVSSQQGAVHCYYNWSSSVPPPTTDGSTQVTIHGNGYRSRFGYAIIVVDFNLDGVDDLVVSSPGYSGFDVRQSGSTPYGNHDNPSFHLYGRVYVLFGRRSTIFPTSVAGNKTTHVVTSTKLRGLGQTLSVGDIDLDGNNDLLIGCPLDGNSSGTLFGMVSKATRGEGQKFDVDTIGVVDLKLTSPLEATNGTTNGTTDGTRPMAWFGHTAMVVSDLLLVGAPFHKMPHPSSDVVGAVHGYRLVVEKEKAMTAVYVSSIVGGEHLEQFGYSMELLDSSSGVAGSETSTSTIVAVSAPDAGSGIHSDVSKWPARSGRVSVLDVNTSFPPGVQQSILEVDVVGTVRGSVSYARFGSRLAFSSKSDALFVSAPLQDTRTLSFDGREMGAVFGFHINELIGNLTTSASFWRNVGGRPRARFGSSIVIGKLLGSTCAACTRSVHGDQLGLVVGSPLAHVDGDERVGVVDVLIP